MSATFICLACGVEKPVSARSGEQNYCGLHACRNASKAAWKKRRLAEDPDYRENQRSCYQDWCRENPGYWTDYRRDHPDQAERNRQMQKERNGRRPRKHDAKPDPNVITKSAPDPEMIAKVAPDPKVIAKVDSIPAIPMKSLETGEYWLIPGELQLIAKVDTISALRVKLIIIPGACK